MGDRGKYMRICIFTLGSRGDVQPFLALAKELIGVGHEAVICTGGSFRTLIGSYDVSFVETSSDLMKIARTPEGKAVLEHPVRNFYMAVELTRNVINPAYRKTLDEFYAAAAGASCIVYHPKALGAVDIARAYGVPCVSMSPVPVVYPITEFPNLVLTTKNLGPTLNRMSYQINTKAESTQIRLINDFRENVLHQKPRKSGIYTFNDGEREIPVIYPISPALFPDVKSWEGHVCLTGFFFLEEEDESLPNEVEEFLAKGQKPIAVTLSSMPLANPERFLSNLRTALKTTKSRAVLLTGNSGISCENDDQIRAYPAISHQLLFSKVRGVIHHGGTGTMAAALKVGVPQMIIPFSVDQPFWAARLQQLGIGLKPLREKEASAEALSVSIRSMDDPIHTEKAAMLAKAIGAEHGTKIAVQYLEMISKRF